MKRALGIILFVLVYAAPVPDAWHAARWKMTVPEVRAAVPASQIANAHDQEMSTNPLTKIMLKTSATYMGERFVVYYEFASEKAFGATVDRLSRISLRLVPYDGRKTELLIRRLTAKYGPPTADESDPGVQHQVIWFSSGEQIWLSEMLPGSYTANAPSLTVMFQPAPAR